MNTWADRVKSEKSVVYINMISLKSFMASEEFFQLSPENQLLLETQVGIMESYVSILKTRLLINGEQE